MKLIVEHFRCFDKQTIIDFKKDKLICLLNGPSGIGKSSIFKGIEFCLYGTGTKIVTYNRKKCRVELIFRDLHITRTKTPNTLTVVYKGKQYIDDGAQSVIYSIFGSNFYLTSMIQQKSTKHFFTCSATDKTLFLQSLIGDTSKIEEWKHECKKKSKDYKERILQLTSQIELLHKNSSTHANTSSTEPSVKKECEPYLNQDKTPNIERVDSYIQKKEADICKLERKISELQSSMNIYYQYTDIQREYKKLQTKLESESSLLSTLYRTNIQSEEECKSYVDNYMLCVTRTKSALQIKKEYDSVSRKLSDYNCTTNQRNKMCDQYRTLISVLKRNKMTTISDILHEYQRIETTIHSLVNECQVHETKKKEYTDLYNKAKCMYECPNCYTSLLLIESTLTINDAQHTSEYMSSINELLTSLISRDPEYKQKQTTIRSLQQKKAELDSVISISNEIDPSLTLYSMTEELTKKEEFDALKTKVSVLESQLKKIGETMDILPTETEYKEQVDKCMEYMQLCREKKGCEKKMQVMKGNIKQVDHEEIEKIKREKIEVECSRNECIEIKKQLIDYSGKLQQYTMYNQLRMQLSDKENELTVIRTKWNQVETFLSKMVQTESETIEELCNQLNTEIDIYMQRFFPTKSIRMQVYTSKLTEQGEKKHCIDVQCFDHEANQIGFDNLSGGEYDRCVLAFFLACNAYSNSPFILLDECLSSLHADAVEDIIELIKERCTDKFVCITLHQANLGLFDEVIHLESL